MSCGQNGGGGMVGVVEDFEDRGCAQAKHLILGRVVED